MEKKVLIEILVDVCGEHIPVKLLRVEGESGVVNSHFEFSMAKNFRKNGDAEIKRTGGTFMTKDLDHLIFRLNHYVNELNQFGVAESEINEKY